jgi:hypothetical protein
LCALASIAEKPEKVKKLFANTRKNKQGVYGVNLYFAGVPQLYIIDERIPYENDKISYAKSKESELWVALMEKAYAVMYGSYKTIEGGENFQSLRDLMGAPCF